MGTQVGTPAWVPDAVEEDNGLNEADTGIAKHWFVHLRRVGHKASERTHVKMDTAGHNSVNSSRASSGIPATNWPTGSSLVSVGNGGKLLAVQHSTALDRQASQLSRESMLSEIS